MALSFATATRNALVAALAALVDADAGPGVIRVYTGGKPANANNAPTGTLLLTYTLDDPAFLAPATGVLSLDGLPLSATGADNGTAGWWRLTDQSGDSILDGTASGVGGGGDLQFSTTTVSTGLTVNLTAGAFTMPAS